jgi:hypothetical protein
MKHLLPAALLFLGACAQPPLEYSPRNEVASREVTLTRTLPPMKAFSASSVLRPTRPNSEIAADFLDLAFELESSRALPVLSRFEGPVTLSVTGRAPAQLVSDLDRLLSRLRIEAGIDISRVAPSSTPASITLQVIPKAKLQALVPHAACFVAPNVSSVREFRRQRGAAQTDWARMTTRTRMAIFLPGDVSPQEMRDCLHEEIAQALGPVNDLYRLDDSVFNDDNFHTVLTGFDMLVLRAYYAPELRSGMTKAEVAQRLPALLARLNPGGGSGQPILSTYTPRPWKEAIETALGGKASVTARRLAAQRAVGIARSQGWSDTRLAFSLFALGRLNLGYDSDAALAAFTEAERLYRAQPRTQLQAANMGVQLAAHALSTGRAGDALAMVESHIRPVMKAENAALLATLLMIKAEALDQMGESTQAKLVRLDSLGWARYGFGSDADVAAQLTEIAAIAANGKG